MLRTVEHSSRAEEPKIVVVYNRVAPVGIVA
jgi:hypothetical protein